MLPQYTGPGHARVSPDGAWCLQGPNYFSRSWRCWIPCVQHGRFFLASEDLLMDHRTRRDLPGAAQGLLTPSSLTTESQQGFPKSDFSTRRRRNGGFLPLNRTAPVPLLVVQSVPRCSWLCRYKKIRLRSEAASLMKLSWESSLRGGAGSNALLSPQQRTAQHLAWMKLLVQLRGTETH